jgi:hypothetical protein
VQPSLQVADASEVLVEPVAVLGAEVSLEPFGAVVDEVEYALAPVQVVDASVDFVGRALHEHAAVESRDAALGRDGDAAAGVRQGLHGDADMGNQGRDAGEVAEPLRRHLVERDAVAEGAAAGVRGGRQERLLARVPAVHAGMRHAAEDGQVAAVVSGLELPTWRPDGGTFFTNELSPRNCLHKRSVNKAPIRCPTAVARGTTAQCHRAACCRRAVAGVQGRAGRRESP